MSYHEISYPSANQRDTIKAYYWTPLDPPKGIVQVIHGFGEHARRFWHLEDALCEAGYVVFADDHLGHGATGVDNGHVGDPHAGSYKTFVDDEKKLHDIAREMYPGIPYFVFGHSWGSLLARGLAALYGDDLRAITIGGNISQWHGIEVALQDAEFEAAFQNDPDGVGAEWFNKAFSGMTDRCDPAEGPNAWIAKDPRIVADHAADPFNTFAVTTDMVYNFCKLYEFDESPEWASMVPTGIPFYLISGDQDPCGNYGEGVYNIANRLIDTDHDVTVKLYTGHRHEIHNERDSRDDVEKTMIAFFDQYC